MSFDICSSQPVSSVSYSRDSFVIASSGSIMDRYLVQDAGTIGIYRLTLGEKGHRGLPTFAEANPAPRAGAQAIEHHEILAVGCTILPQGPETERYADDPACAGQRRMDSRQRHCANHFSDAHGR